MNKKYHLREKKFLGTSQDERDYVVAVVEDAREKSISDPKFDDDTEISLHIGDWRHEVELHFYVDTLEDRENALHKVRTLAEVIDSFRRAVESEIEILNARQPV